MGRVGWSWAGGRLWEVSAAFLAAKAGSEFYSFATRERRSCDAAMLLVRVCVLL